LRNKKKGVLSVATSFEAVYLEPSSKNLSVELSDLGGESPDSNKFGLLDTIQQVGFFFWAVCISHRFTPESNRIEHLDQILVLRVA
jgi:hypothetical protein